MSCLHRLTLGGGDGVLHRGAVHLGDGVAVLHLHRDQLHLGRLDTVLSGHLATRVLHCCLHTGGHCSSRRSQHLGVSISLGEEWSRTRRSITENVHHILADRFILNLLSLHHLFLTDILSSGSALLGHQHIIGGHTVRSWSRGEWSKLRVSSGSSEAGGCQQTQRQKLKQEIFNPGLQKIIHCRPSILQYRAHLSHAPTFCKSIS